MNRSIPHIVSVPVVEDVAQNAKDSKRFRGTESSQAGTLVLLHAIGGFRPLCFVPPLLSQIRSGVTFHGRGPVVCPWTVLKSRPGTDSLRNRKRRGSRWIETTRWGANSEIPAWGYSVAQGEMPSSDQALSLAELREVLPFSVLFRLSEHLS